MRQPIDLYKIKLGSAMESTWPHWRMARAAMFRRGVGPRLGGWQHPFFRIRDFWSTSHPLTTPPLDAARPPMTPKGDEHA